MSSRETLAEKLIGYSRIVFVCEGTNEEAVIRWMLETGCLCIEGNQCDFDHLRSARTKKGKKDLIQNCLKYDMGDNSRKIGIVYILDSKAEKWTLRGIAAERIDIVRVITSPEIEVLLTFKDLAIQRAWAKECKSDSRHPSIFVEQYFSIDNIKNGKNFCEAFGTIDSLRQAAQSYKTQKHPKEYCLFDLFREMP